MNYDLSTVIQTTFDKEFVDMLKTSMFIPFISSDFRP